MTYVLGGSAGRTGMQLTGGRRASFSVPAPERHYALALALAAGKGALLGLLVLAALLLAAWCLLLVIWAAEVTPLLAVGTLAGLVALGVAGGLAVSR